MGRNMERKVNSII
ncbi:hypothetical protein Nmel_011873 [Mimus melanotis]